MVTHDPVAAAYTDRVVFLADGRIVDELRHPDREQILHKMQQLAAQEPTPPTEEG
jgi:putative ABC transport system ATP-binding protein